MKLFRIQPEGKHPCWFKAVDQSEAQEAFEKGWHEVPKYSIIEVTTLEQFMEDAPDEFMLADEAAY